MAQLAWLQDTLHGMGELYATSLTTEASSTHAEVMSPQPEAEVQKLAALREMLHNRPSSAGAPGPRAELAQLAWLQDALRDLGDLAYASVAMEAESSESAVLPRRHPARFSVL